MITFMKKLVKKVVPRRQHVFKIAKDAKDIVRVYRIGPHSCMKGKSVVAAYAKGDLAVAYLEHIETKKVVARAVIWPAKRRYYRIYGKVGPATRLANSLAYRGYTQGRLVGAKVGYSDRGELPSIDGMWRYSSHLGDDGHYYITIH